MSRTRINIHKKNGAGVRTINIIYEIGKFDVKSTKLKKFINNAVDDQDNFYWYVVKPLFLELAPISFFI